MQSSFLVRLGSVAMIAAMLIGASSAIVVGSSQAHACVTVTVCGGGGGPLTNALVAVGTNLDPASAAKAAVDGLESAPPPPTPPIVLPVAVEYTVMLALIIL